MSFVGPKASCLGFKVNLPSQGLSTISHSCNHLVTNINNMFLVPQCTNYLASSLKFCKDIDIVKYSAGQDVTC